MGETPLPLSGRPSFLVKTKDRGATWEKVGEIPEGSQPTIVQRTDGSLLAYLRSDPFILESESNDGGKTWTDPKQTNLHCPGAGIAMTRLANGNLVLVHNDSPTERSPLSIRRSTNEGKTWSDPLHLESNPGEYSYPCVLQTSDGRIHVTYTFRRYSIKHVEMNEDWLIHMDRPN
jgi:predicted neuraminidase